MRYNKSKYSTDPNLVLNLPLYETGLKENIFASYDIYAHKCSVTGATWGSQGRTLNGIGDLISVPSHSALDITTAITLWAWVKPDTFIDSFPKLITKPVGAGWAVPYFYYCLTAGGGADYFVRFGVIEAVNDIVSLDVLTVGQWYFLMGTYDGANEYLYIDMVQKATKAVTGAIPTSTQPLAIGVRSTTSAGERLHGVLGECGIYNRALSVVEGQNLMLATKWRYS